MKKKENIEPVYVYYKNIINDLFKEEDTLSSLKKSKSSLRSSYIDLVRSIDDRIEVFEFKTISKDLHKNFFSSCFDETEAVNGAFNTAKIGCNQYLALDGQIQRHLRYSEDFYYEIKQSKHQAVGAARIKEINEELRNLRVEFQNAPTNNILFKIKTLVQELNTLINYCYKEQKKFIKRLRQVYYKSKALDIRLRFRSIIHFLFKCLNDFSGCEEEASSGLYPRRNLILFH